MSQQTDVIKPLAYAVAPTAMKVAASGKLDQLVGKMYGFEKIAEAEAAAIVGTRYKVTQGQVKEAFENIKDLKTGLGKKTVKIAAYKRHPSNVIPEAWNVLRAEKVALLGDYAYLLNLKGDTKTAQAILKTHDKIACMAFDWFKEYASEAGIKTASATTAAAGGLLSKAKDLFTGKAMQGYGKDFLRSAAKGTGYTLPVGIGAYVGGKALMNHGADKAVETGGQLMDKARDTAIQTAGGTAGVMVGANQLNNILSGFTKRSSVSELHPFEKMAFHFLIDEIPGKSKEFETFNKVACVYAIKEFWDKEASEAENLLIKKKKLANVSTPTSAANQDSRFYPNAPVYPLDPAGNPLAGEGSDKEASVKKWLSSGVGALGSALGSILSGAPIDRNAMGIVGNVASTALGHAGSKIRTAVSPVAEAIGNRFKVIGSVAKHEPDLLFPVITGIVRHDASRGAQAAKRFGASALDAVDTALAAAEHSKAFSHLDDAADLGGKVIRGAGHVGDVIVDIARDVKNIPGDTLIGKAKNIITHAPEIVTKPVLEKAVELAQDINRRGGAPLAIVDPSDIMGARRVIIKATPGSSRVDTAKHLSEAARHSELDTPVRLPRVFELSGTSVTGPTSTVDKVLNRVAEVTTGTQPIGPAGVFTPAAVSYARTGPSKFILSKPSPDMLKPTTVSEVLSAPLDRATFIADPLKRVEKITINPDMVGGTISTQNVMDSLTPSVTGMPFSSPEGKSYTLLVGRGVTTPKAPEVLDLGKDFADRVVDNLAGDKPVSLILSKGEAGDKVLKTISEAVKAQGDFIKDSVKLPRDHVLRRSGTYSSSNPFVDVIDNSSTVVNTIAEVPNAFSRAISGLAEDLSQPSVAALVGTSTGRGAVPIDALALAANRLGAGSMSVMNAAQEIPVTAIVQSYARNMPVAQHIKASLGGGLAGTGANAAVGLAKSVSADLLARRVATNVANEVRGDIISELLNRVATDPSAAAAGLPTSGPIIEALKRMGEVKISSLVGGVNNETKKAVEILPDSLQYSTSRWDKFKDAIGLGSTAEYIAKKNLQSDAERLYSFYARNPDGSYRSSTNTSDAKHMREWLENPTKHIPEFARRDEKDIFRAAPDIKEELLNAKNKNLKDVQERLKNNKLNSIDNFIDQHSHRMNRRPLTKALSSAASGSLLSMAGGGLGRLLGGGSVLDAGETAIDAASGAGVGGLAGGIFGSGLRAADLAPYMFRKQTGNKRLIIGNALALANPVISGVRGFMSARANRPQEA